MNNRLPSAKEILFCRDQVTGVPLSIDDESLNYLQRTIRDMNHIPSELSKGKGATWASDASVKIGDLVYIKFERNKFKGRDRYMVMQIHDKQAILQKLIYPLYQLIQIVIVIRMRTFNQKVIMMMGS